MNCVLASRTPLRIHSGIQVNGGGTWLIRTIFGVSLSLSVLPSYHWPSTEKVAQKNTLYIMRPSTPESPLPPSTLLTYSIARCSEHSGKYHASNIIVDRPMDHTSRWSGAHQNPNAKQWVLLRLENLSVLS